MSDEKDILTLLVKESYLSKEDAQNAWAVSRKDKTSAIDYLIKTELLSRDVLGRAIAESMNVGFADLGSKQPSSDDSALLPKELAQKFRTVVYEVKGDHVVLASDHPDNSEAMTELSQAFEDRTVEIRYALSEEIDEILVQYREPLGKRFTSIIESGAHVAPTIIDAVITDAVATKASDIHFEPELETIEVRLRIDGVLQDVGSIDKKMYQSIVNRIKVMAKLRIDEHSSVQDGAIRFANKEGEDVDLRVSVAPTISGEKIVIRLLSAHSAEFTLGDLGLSEQGQQIIENAGKKPFGMIVVTGPTGSGKTTTLYSLMKYIKNRDINITTIEDPVEYKIPGIAQIQVNPQTNLTFGEGLRSIVRQDPDVILVGEVRDEETAEIAVNAALTGHLLLTTFHANDAATAIPRLLELGTEPFLLASTLEVMVAQRLLRKLCQSCRVGQDSDIQQKLKELALPAFTQNLVAQSLTDGKGGTATMYSGKGCNVCHGTGYRGRIGVFEIIPLDDKLKELILQKPSRNEIWQQARKSGATSLFEDGLAKVKQGETTLDELLRVIPIPSEGEAAHNG